MKLRGIDFGSILDASGAEGFFGEGYRHHKLLGPFGPNFLGCTFVAKTTTLEYCKGNMPMREDGITPVELRPRCILPNFRHGNIRLSARMFRDCYMLNAVGLSGPGADALFRDGRWQARTTPFFLSFMAIAKTAEERAEELKRFVRLFASYLPQFHAPVGLQVNKSCPNRGLNLDPLVDEARNDLVITAPLDVPVMFKFNVLTPIPAVKAIAESPGCDALCISNTIGFDKAPDKIDWKKLFGSDVSPLAEFGGGGLSGRPLRNLALTWLNDARNAGIAVPINAGGGILDTDDVQLFRDYGASSAFVGSVANLRPLRVQSIIKTAKRLF